LDPDLRSLVEHRQPEVRRVSGVAERLPFPDECLDLVICSWLLEHLAKPEHVFHEVARVLRSAEPVKGKSGGHLVFLTPNAWHPLTWINRVLSRLGGWHTRLVRRLYERAAEDTFPPVYRANTRQRAERFAVAAGLTPVSLCTVGDPTYLAFTESFYRLATAVERVTPSWMKVHIVGDFQKT
jgi:SAM-dependent methyltransferase